MKKALVEAILLLFVFSAAFLPVHATQTASVALYFDRDLTTAYADCPYGPPGSILDTVYVAASGFATPIEGIEYKVVFPPEVMFVSDLSTDRGLKIGDSFNGASIAFFAPQDAASPVLVQEILILWMCDGCPTVNIPIEFAAHPMTGSLRAVTSDLVLEDVIGHTTWVCPACLGCSPAQASVTPSTVRACYASPQCVLDCPSGDGGVILPGEAPGEHHTPDLDNDGMVWLVDFSLFAMAYMNAFDSDMDFYCSGNLDLIDFVLFTRHWLHSGSIPVAPSTWGKIKAQFSE